MLAQKDLPIGVFDSGLGGLTILEALRQRLPNENFIYLGDVARLPYGTKSKETVSEYARQCANFLLGRPVKAVVVACNTASAMALEALKAHLPRAVFGVIQPGVAAGVTTVQRKAGRYLVLATAGTVASDAYRREFIARDPQASVAQISAPLLVSLAEEGWFDHPITAQVIQHYLADVDWDQVDALVLGCTHFPLLRRSFEKVVPPAVPIVHAGARLAEQVAQWLGETGLGTSQAHGGAVEFLSTDRLPPGIPMLGIFGGTPLQPQIVHLN